MKRDLAQLGASSIRERPRDRTVIKPPPSNLASWIFAMLALGVLVVAKGGGLDFLRPEKTVHPAPIHFNQPAERTFP